MAKNAPEMSRIKKFSARSLSFIFLVSFFILAFILLGCWQLQRAEEKKRLISELIHRSALPPQDLAELAKAQDLRFYRVQLHGVFDRDHDILLDNKVVKGRVGYELYTPFIPQGLDHPILVDRGFVPAGSNRQQLPKLQPEISTAITGVLYQTSIPFHLGKMIEAPNTWPLRVQYLDHAQIAAILGKTLYPYVLILDQAKSPRLNAEQISVISPEKHKAYAVQWFALALTLLILFVLLKRAE